MWFGKLRHIINSMRPTKVLRALFILSLVLWGLRACFKPPEITASSREDAMNKCMADARAEVKQILEERERAKVDPKSADRDTNPDYYSDYTYGFLLDNKWETVELENIYCNVLPYDMHKGYFQNVGYLEYVRRSTDQSPRVVAEVKQLIVSLGYTWKEQ